MKTPSPVPGDMSDVDRQKVFFDTSKVGKSDNTVSRRRTILPGEGVDEQLITNDKMDELIVNTMRVRHEV